jgi:hypothetical protein
MISMSPRRMHNIKIQKTGAEEAITALISARF